MARPLRSHIPDGPSHVFCRGIRRERIFLSERDGFAYLYRAADSFARFGVECWTYCLMPTHYHFVLFGRQADKSAAMHRLNGGYAQWFNRQLEFRGHLFADRHGTRVITDEHHLLEVVRYVVLNPVRAGLCEHPREWRWSSYAATVGLKPKPDFLELRWMDGLIAPDCVRGARRRPHGRHRHVSERRSGGRGAPSCAGGVWSSSHSGRFVAGVRWAVRGNDAEALVSTERRARPRTPHRAVQRRPAAQRVICEELLTREFARLSGLRSDAGGV